MIDGTSWSGDDDVHTAVELLELAKDRLAAVDGHDLHAEPAAVLEDRLAHLHGELPGGNQDQCHGAGRHRGVDQFERRQRKGGGLAGTCGGLSEQVVAGDQQRDRLALDRCRLLVAQVVEGAQRLGPESQRGEAVKSGVVIGRVHRRLNLRRRLRADRGARPPYGASSKRPIARRYGRGPWVPNLLRFGHWRPIRSCVARRLRWPCTGWPSSGRGWRCWCTPTRREAPPPLESSRWRC